MTFKAGNNQWLLGALFYETAQDKEKEYVRFTLKDDDHLGHTSLYRKYMEIADPTEYRFATEVLGGWAHWQALLQTPFLPSLVARWREELDIKLRSEALAGIISTSKGTSREAFQAQKFLQSYGNTNTKGRPSKAQVLSAAKEIAADKSRVQADYLRLVGEGNGG